MDVRRIVGEWVLVRHTTFAPGHELARHGRESDSTSIVVSEGRSHEGLDEWPFRDGPCLARRRDLIQDTGYWVVIEDVGLATSFMELPRVLPIGMAWTVGRAIALALAKVHDAGLVIGGLMPSIVFIEPDGDVLFAPRVLAFRPASSRTTTPEADVAALARMMRDHVGVRDQEAFDAGTRDCTSASALAERLPNPAPTRADLAAWLTVGRTSLHRRVRWLLVAAHASREIVIAAFDEIAESLGVPDRVEIEEPEHDNPSFMTDTEIGWDMERLARRGPAPVRDPLPDVARFVCKHEDKHAAALERACETILVDRLVRSTKPMSPYRCPSCDSTKVAAEAAGIEFTTLTCATCGRSDIVDTWQMDDWRL